MQCWPRYMSPQELISCCLGEERCLQKEFTKLFNNSLWPSDTIWRHKSGSTLAQVMACCLTAPSHYLNQYWLIISKIQWHPSESNFTRHTSAIIHWNKLKNYLSKILLKSRRGQWVKTYIFICLHHVADMTSYWLSMFKKITNLIRAWLWLCVCI